MRMSNLVLLEFQILALILEWEPLVLDPEWD
jgi:hypothetical protein